MKILCVTPQVPWPARQGTTLRNLHLLRALAGEHEVDLLTFTEGAPLALDASVGGATVAGECSSLEPNAGEPASSGPLTSLCRRIEAVPAPQRQRADRLLDLALGRADMEGRLRSPVFAARLDTLLREGHYDAVHLEGFEVAGYLLGPRALRDEAYGRCPRPMPMIVFDDHNAEYQLQASAARIDRDRPRRWPRAVYSAVQARRLRAREALYCAAADVTLAVSDDDALALEAIVPGLGAVVVPNGVDVAALPAPRPAPQPELFFAGKLDYRPNVDACEWLVHEILPLVRRRVPGVRVVLAGRDPAPAVHALAGAGVEVTGALSDAELDRRRGAAWVYVVPMRMGSGVRFKALEAMAAGIPLVATPLGAAGLGVTPGVQAMIAAGAPDFAAAVVQLLEHPQHRRALAAAARALAAERHDWRQITPRLLDVYARLIPLRQPSGGPVSLAATVLDERPSVDALLSSLAAQSKPPDECVIVDGGSADGTWERLAGAAALISADHKNEVRENAESQNPESKNAAPGASPLPQQPQRAEPSLVLQRHPGVNIAQGRNLAIAAAKHDFIAVTDAGVQIAPEWLARLIAPLQRDACLHVTSGFFVSAPRGAWERALGATTLPDVGEIDPTRFLPSSRSVAFRRGAWLRAGGYPEWLDYGEDLVFDLALRRFVGPARFVPRATVAFRPRASPAAFFRQYYRYARGDGKADLWRKRHAIRYGSYLAGAGMLALSLGRPRRWPYALPRISAPFLLALGGVAYLHRPFIRLSMASAGWAEFCRAAPFVPLARVIGDVAKMLGYPVGVWWRWRAGPQIGTPSRLSSARG
ncbi:MAG: glycosyltransferase [Chloroflexota bacterium]|nr:glycosyltransferase [Chloroflexota bacterium]